MGIVSENRIPSSDLHRDFRAGIGPLQLGVVLVALSLKKKRTTNRTLQMEHALKACKQCYVFTFLFVNMSVCGIFFDKPIKSFAEGGVRERQAL